jgi:hypothetical protein
MDFPNAFTCDAETTPAAAHGFHTCAAVLMQLLTIERGRGAWVIDLYEKLRVHLETEPMPQEYEGVIEPGQWRETVILALDNVFGHRLLVDGDDLDI